MMPRRKARAVAIKIVENFAFHRLECSFAIFFEMGIVWASSYLIGIWYPESAGNIAMAYA